MTTSELNDQILKSAEETINVAKKELGKTLDYSIKSLDDIESLIQHVKKYFSQLSKQRKLTDKIVQNASTSIGSYIGETIRRQYGGTWIPNNNILGEIVINSSEFSPILYVFQRLTKGSENTIQQYMFNLNQEINPQVKSVIENKGQEKVEYNVKSGKPKRNILLIMGGIVVSLCILSSILVLFMSLLFDRKPTELFTPSTPTPTRLPPTNIPIPTPSTYSGEPISYLPILPDGFVIDYSIPEVDTITNEGIRLHSIAFTNNNAVNKGDLVSVVYFMFFYPNESSAISGYNKILDNLATDAKIPLDRNIGLDGADASALYMAPYENNILEGKITSRIKNVVITTQGLTVYDPQNVSVVFLKSFTAKIAEIQILGIRKFSGK